MQVPAADPSSVINWTQVLLALIAALPGAITSIVWALRAKVHAQAADRFAQVAMSTLRPPRLPNIPRIDCQDEGSVPRIPTIEWGSDEDTEPDEDTPREIPPRRKK